MTTQETTMDNELETLEILLKNNFKDVYDSLQPGASEKQIAKLVEICLRGNSIPDDLFILYRWHDGQTGYGSLNQNDNRTFMPIKEVIDTWSFLNDPMEDICEPISKSWLPITDNGGGDHLVYETEGTNKGKILAYWHDDECRSVEYNSLKEWILAAVEASKS